MTLLPVTPDEGDTARLRAAIIEHFPDGYDQVDLDWDLPLRREALAALDVLVLRAEQAERERDEALDQARDVSEWLQESEDAREQAEKALRDVLAGPRWLSIGSIDNTAELRTLSREKYERLLALSAAEPAAARPAEPGETA